jgi:hypothetical protein
MLRHCATLESGIPHTVQPPDTFIGCMIKHVPGNRIAIFQGDTQPSSLALNIYAEVEPGVFTVEKAARPSDRQPEEAYPWMFERARAKIGPRHLSLVTGLLLAPSVLGQGLFGADKSPGSEAEDRFGTISLVVDNLDKSYSLNVEMPLPAYPELGKLVVCREVAVS